MFHKKKGTIPGGFGLLQSGKGTLGLRGAGRGGLGGLAGLGGLGGVRIFLNGAGGDASDALGNDLLGRYGLLSLAGIDDFTGGLLGGILLSPGELLGLGGGGRAVASNFGLLSGK